MTLDQCLRGESPFLDRAGLEVFNDNVSQVNQTQCQFSPFGVSEIEGDTALVSALEQPPQTTPAHHSATPPSERIAAARKLNFDDVGPEICHETCAEGPGDIGTQLEDPDSAQW